MTYFTGFLDKIASKSPKSGLLKLNFVKFWYQSCLKSLFEFQILSIRNVCKTRISFRWIEIAKMESEQLEDALSVLDQYRDGGTEDEYGEVVDLLTDVKNIGQFLFFDFLEFGAFPEAEIFTDGLT